MRPSGFVDVGRQAAAESLHDSIRSDLVRCSSDHSSHLHGSLRSGRRWRSPGTVRRRWPVPRSRSLQPIDMALARAGSRLLTSHGGSRPLAGSAEHVSAQGTAEARHTGVARARRELRAVGPPRFVRLSGADTTALDWRPAQPWGGFADRVGVASGAGRRFAAAIGGKAKPTLCSRALSITRPCAAAIGGKAKPALCSRASGLRKVSWMTRF